MISTHGSHEEKDKFNLGTFLNESVLKYEDN